MQLMASWSQAGATWARPAEMVLQTEIDVLDSSEEEQAEEAEEHIIVLRKRPSLTSP